jgi:hypothetical protein
LFWVIFVLTVVLGVYSGRAKLASGELGFVGGGLLILVLIFLLGWRVFGPMLM